MRTVAVVRFTLFISVVGALYDCDRVHRENGKGGSNMAFPMFHFYLYSDLVSFPFSRCTPS